MTNHPNRSKQQQQATHTPGPWHITTQHWNRNTGTALNGETLTVRGSHTLLTS